MAVGGASGGGGGQGVRAGKAFVEFSAKDAGLSSFMRGMEKKLSGFGKAATGIGAAMAGLGGIPLGAGLLKVTDTLDQMGRMEEVARAFGLTSEAASGLFSMLEQNGGVLKENMEALSQFGSRVGEFMGGADAESMAGKLFGGLGITKEDLTAAKTIDNQLFLVLGKLHELQAIDPGQANALLDLVGGTDSAKQLKAVLNRSEAELRAMAQAGQMSTEDMNAARDANMAYRKSTLALEQAWKQVAVALAPTIQQLSEGLLPVIKDMAGWIKENKGLIVGLAGGLVAVAGAGVALMGLGITITGLTATVSALGAVLGVVLSPAGLGVAAIAALVIVLAAAGEEVNTTGSALSNLEDDFAATWQGITAAIKSGETEKAFKVLTTGMSVMWDDMTNGISEGWHRLVDEIAKGMVELIDVFTNLQKAKELGISVFSMGLARSANPSQDSDLMRALKEDAATAKRARDEAAKAKRGEFEQAVQDARGRQGSPLFGMAAAAVLASLVKPIAQGAHELARAAADARGTFSSRQDAFRQLGSEPIFDKIERNTRETADAVKKGVVVGV